MAEARYWVTYSSKCERADGTDTVTFERVANTSKDAGDLANEFIRSAEGYMNAEPSVTECVVHVYDSDNGTFPLHRTLRRIGCENIPYWFALDE